MVSEAKSQTSLLTMQQKGIILSFSLYKLAQRQKHVYTSFKNLGDLEMLNELKNTLNLKPTPVLTYKASKREQ